MKLSAIACDDQGKPIAVARPDNPELAASLAEEMAAKGDHEAFARHPEIVQEHGVRYLFAGWLSHDRKCVVDDEGVKIDEIERGDSFISSGDLKTMLASA